MASNAGDGDEVEVTLEHAVAGGSVLARPADAPVVLVDGGLPGEVVRVRVDARRRSLWRATVVEVVERSPHRVDPPCPVVARGCGGCDLQHADAAGQRSMKRQIVVDALRRLGRRTDAEALVVDGPMLPSTGFRTSVRGAIDPAGRFAFRHRRGHDVVDPGHCLVAHPLLDELIAEGRFGSAREVTLRAGAATGERLAVVDPGADDVRVPDDVLVVGLDELRAGKRAWLHEEVHDRTFRISARSFFQTRADGAAALVDAVRSAAGEGDGPVVDACCGVGLFAAFLGGAGRSVVAIERNRSSVADAKTNLAGIDARVVAVDLDRWHPSPASLVVADPYREGLGRRAVAQLAATGARRLVLVSCDPAAFGRDTQLLTAAGYQLDRATIIDLFPHTHHVEVVSTFFR